MGGTTEMQSERFYLCGMISKTAVLGFLVFIHGNE